MCIPDKALSTIVYLLMYNKRINLIYIKKLTEKTRQILH